MRFISLLGSLLILGAMIAPGAAQEGPVGSAQKVRPEAGARFHGVSRTLEVGAPVHRDELLHTGKSGRLRIGLLDGTVVDLGGNARMKLDSFVLSDQGKPALVVNSLTGAMRFIGGAIDKSSPGAVRVVTPMATMIVRGTEFFAGPIDGSYGVFVLHGEVNVVNSAGSVTLRDGEGTSLTSSRAAPGPVKRWPADKIARAESLVAF